MGSDKSSSKGQAWFCTTGLPSDIVIEIDEMSFHLHKFPLMSRSRKLHELITEKETKNPAVETEDQDDDVTEDIELQISLPDFPGGSETFEIAAKYCYGVKIDISSSNVVSLRCAGEYLEMTEDYCEDNLISKTEKFLSQSVLKCIQESVKTLKSCEGFLALAESLNIPQRCINSIAVRASSTDPSLFGWPMNDPVEEERAANQILWNGIDTGIRHKKGKRSGNAENWIEEVGTLSLPLFKRLISAMKERDLSSDIIESSLISYAKRSIPGISRSTRKQSGTSIATETEQRELIETIITNLPLAKNSRSHSTAIRHLFGLLRTANILSVSESSRSVLEKRIGFQLEQASLDDLLIPSYSYLIETLYDVDCVQRILAYFLDSLEDRSSAVQSDGEDVVMLSVGKIIDGYLSEIASDANLRPQKFIDLAVVLPDQARSFDDGLYRAVDVYLKAHPSVTEEEREQISGVLDCQKLTLEACTHAAQNERLPLRAVVQVLFFEQLQLRHAISGSLQTLDLEGRDSPRPSLLQQEQQLSIEPVRDNGTWNAAVRENQVLRLDMDSMRSRVHELERECSSMKKVIRKIDGVGMPKGNGNAGKNSWISKKFGCKFKTQVCDSREGAVVETKKTLRHPHLKSQ
ncbi:hypothetical protein ACHQM5_016954 [Ranunculus cassubicifolius]